LFSQLPAPPVWGTLLQSEADPQLFYSFGPWQRDADIQAMRANPAVQAAFAALRDTCIEMTPGTYRRVRHVEIVGGR
jgi:quinol monooxygenase YgiN